jgi:hypothetical protein
LSQILETVPADELDRFEAIFLSFAGSLPERDQRIPAMELYAWLKMAETAQYNQFRGFIGSGHALP